MTEREKMLETNFFWLAFFLLAASALFLSGCTSSDTNADQQGPGIFRGGNHSGFGTSNLTDEQRQQMMEERMQAAADACINKAQGDSCAMQNPGGSANGTCESRNGTLACGFPGQWNGQNRTRSDTAD